MTRVLIVDDDEGFRHVARRLLERSGFAVVGDAAHAEAALQQVALLRPDAVLSDVNLPGEDGVELVARMLRTHPAMRVLLTSTDLDAVTNDEARRAGAVGFIGKTDLMSADLVSLLSP